MTQKKGQIRQLADALLKEWGIEKPRGYISRTERLLRWLDVEDYDAVIAAVHAEKMKNPAAVEAEVARKQKRIDEEYAGKSAKPGIFDDVTAAEIAMEFHEASQLGDRGKMPRRDPERDYDGAGKIRPRTSISYDGP